MRVCLVVLMFVGLTLGCTSYRFTGATLHSGDMRNVVTKDRYRVDRLRLRVLRGLGGDEIRKQQAENPYAAPDPWSIPQTASLSSEEQLRTLLQNAYPSVFSADAEKRLEVRVSSVDEVTDGLWSILCPYLITLGIAPTYQTVRSECLVEVLRVDGESLVGKSTIRFDTNMRMSATSPLGAMIGYDREGGVLSQETGSGVGCWPHTDVAVAKKVQSVFAETVAGAVVSIILQAESRR